MMTKKNKVLITGLTLAVVLAFFNIFYAKQVSAQTMQVGVHFMMADMQGDFKKNVEDLGLGVAASFGYRFKDSPVILGGSFGFINYGSERRREPFSTTIPDVTVEVINRNNIILFDLFMSLEPAVGTIRPYIGGQLGFSYLYTDTKIEEVTGIQEIASDTNFDDFAFNMGAFGGLKIRVWNNDEAYSESERGLRGVFIDLRLDYLYGTRAEYLKEGSIIRNSSTSLIEYDVNESNTSMLLYKIGISVEF
jgi:hypothetical protein